MEKSIIIFKALSDMTRVRIVRLLKGVNMGLCVCEIVYALNKAQYNISRHLKELKTAGLVKENKTGRWSYYSLAPSEDRVRDSVLKAVVSIPDAHFEMDFKRLKKVVSMRKDGKCAVAVKGEMP